MQWIKNSFEDFQKGTMGNGGQNIYVSAGGVLQRVFHFDINGDGYPDILFANSQSMGERAPVNIYDDPLHCEAYHSLPTGGSSDAVFADISGDGYDDLIIACQHDGTHSDITSCIYYGSPGGLSERYRVELPVPGATSVAAGDFDGTGRLSLVFAHSGGLRVFPNGDGGILPYNYRDLKLNVRAVASDDLDGDGYDDLYMKFDDGSAHVLWGGPDGLSERRVTTVSGNKESLVSAGASTMGRNMYRGWKPCILTIDGIRYLFSAGPDTVTLFSCGNDREIRPAITLNCRHAMAAAVGDLDGDGKDDLAIVCCEDRAKSGSSSVFWNDDGFSEGNFTSFPTRSACHAEISDLNGDGRMQLLICQGGNSAVNSSQSQILSFSADRAVKILATPQHGDAVRLISGRTMDAPGRQIAAVCFETGRRDGDEPIYIYLGGPEGYDPGNKIELPGRSAVGGIMYDANDDGFVDVLVSNCAEDAPQHDTDYLYLGSENGFDPARRIAIPSVRDSGAIVGDFRKCGYLDIATGGWCNRSVRIFRGGPEGYDVDNPEVIVFGPDPEGYSAPVIGDPALNHVSIREDERETYRRYGEVRWLFTADFNGDGWLDLFVSQILGPECYILWGGPDGFSTDRMQILYTDGVASANAADLDGDGWLDLILSGHMSTGKSEQGKYESYITIYWGGPDGYKEHRKTQLPAYCANSVCVGDFNGNGLLDIYASSYNNGRSRDLLSYVYYNRPGRGFSLLDYQPLFNHSGSGCVAGDFDGNGYADVAVACHKENGNHPSTSFIFWGGPDGLSDANKTSLPTIGPHGMAPVDAGNLMDRGPEEYYVSEVIPIPAGISKTEARWQGTIPDSCWVRIQFRSGSDRVSLSETAWSDWYGEGANDFNAAPQDCLLQYRLALGARCSCGTPRITSVVIDIE